MSKFLPLRGRWRAAPEGASAAALAAIVLLLATPAGAETPVVSLFIVKNATAAPIRCFVMEGGPVTKLVTLKPGQERTSRAPAAGRVSLACPKVRDTVFGPLPPGRYEFRTVQRRTDLVSVAP